MKIKNTLIFTFLLFTASVTTSAKIVETESNEDFYRVKFFAQKELLKVSKLENKLILKTLNNDVYNELKKDISSIKKSKFFSGIKENEPVEGNAIYSIEILLNKDVEVFSFYKNRDKAYYVDLWSEKGEVSSKAAAIKVVKKPTPKAVKVSPKIVKRPKAKVVTIKVAEKKKTVKKELDYRDFRYGAAFIWDYNPVSPTTKKIIHLERKTPEFFFPIKDREYEKNEREAHIQLSINLYRKKKWGLMYKSIKLYQKKYGEDDNFDIHEYMKANALLRESKEKGELKPIDTAVAMFSNIADRSNNYELRKGIYKYLIQYYTEKNDYVKTLSFSKRFFADAKESFDYEELEQAADLILTSLARLNQIDKIKNLLRDKTIIKIVSKQMLVAYEIYTLVKLGQEDQAIREYKKIAKTTKGKLLPSIYYNIAEAYFREGKMKEAINLYDLYLKHYSFHSKSSHSRLRIALASDLLGKPHSIVEELYRNTINRSNDTEVSHEARVRYVAYRTIRKIKKSESDIETRVFLDKGDGVVLSKDLERLLWLTRLRTFIVDGEYEKALSFLTALPLAAMKPTYKKVFEGDGAEIVFGIIKKNYETGNFGKAVRAWEIYKNVYFEKVAADPEIQFVVAKSYMNLGLWEGFQRTYSLMLDKKNEKMRSFPIWVNRTAFKNKEIIEKELQILRNIKLGNWDSVEKIVANIVKLEPKYPKATFYRAKSFYKRNQFKSAEQSYEKFFAANVNFDYIDTSDLLEAVSEYSEAIYEQGKYKKFLEVTEALMSDAKKFKVSKEAIETLSERVNYLRLEVLFNQNGERAISEGNKFVKEFAKSTYINRVRFLLGRENLRLKNVKIGEKILNDLINGTDVADYIKEMARAELTLLNLKNRTL